jgi:hypothetical protein
LGGWCSDFFTVHKVQQQGNASIMPGDEAKSVDNYKLGAHAVQVTFQSGKEIA